MIDNIKADIKRSLLGGERFRAETLKLMIAALQNAQIAKTAELSDEEIVAVLQKELKKRAEAVEMYEKAGAKDRADKERSEIDIISAYVPKPLNGDDLKKAVDSVLDKVDTGPMNFGQLMQVVLAELENPDKAELAAYLKTKL